MTNDNHEYYNSDPICTFTDPVTDSNPMTSLQVNSCVLSAGIPYGFENRAWIKTGGYAALNEANSNSPWNNGSTGMGVIHDTSELIDIPEANWDKYFHVIYRAFSGNVTQLDLKKYRNVLTITAQTATVGGVTKTYYDWTITTQYGAAGDWTNSSLAPYRIIPDGSDMLGIPMSGGFYNIWGHSEFAILPTRSTYGHYSNFNSMCNSRVNVVPDTAPYTKWSEWDYELVSESDYKWYDDGHCAMYVYGTLAGGFHAYGAQLTNNVDDIKMLCAICGLKFHYDGTDYKPIVEGGIVTGYTDDMTSESEWDTWEDIGDHTIPDDPSPVPPTPGGDDEDNDDPIPVTGAPYSSGLARYYVTTSGSLILSHISSAMGAWNLKDTGKDLYKNIISCKLIKSPAPIPVSGSEPFTVYGVTLQYEGSDITLPVINDNPTASFGSYSIPRKFNDFRDYAPYTKVEIYLPYCGWTVLPSHVVGRSVSVTYYTDIIAATCKAVVYCGSNVVAEAAGVIGLDIPMVTENAGAKAEAVTMGLLAYGKAGLQTALGVGAAVATKGKAGVKQAVSGLGDVISAYSQTAMAFNQNYTEINGKNGDGCCIAGISAIVIKITRPKYGSNTTAPYVPSQYPHSTGYVSMKSGTVGSFTGLLVADNVDTSRISGATDREKQLIKLYLESGIYVNHPN